MCQQVSIGLVAALSIVCAWCSLGRIGKGQVTHRSGAHSALLKLLEGGRRGLGSLDKLELGLAAIGALWLRHGDQLLQPNRGLLSRKKGECRWRREREGKGVGFPGPGLWELFQQAKELGSWCCLGLDSCCCVAVLASGAPLSWNQQLAPAAATGTLPGAAVLSALILTKIVMLFPSSHFPRLLFWFSSHVLVFGERTGFKGMHTRIATASRVLFLCV